MPKVRKHPARGSVRLAWPCLAGWLVAACVSFPAWAAPSGPEDSPAASSDRAVYWSVSDAEGRSGFLLGTVHSEDARVLEFTAPFLEQLGACDTFAMELVPNLPTMQRLLQYMELPEGERLVDHVGAERYAAVESAVVAYGIPADRLQRMKPWAAMMTLSLPPPRTGLFLDFSLSLRAAGAGLEVVGLETLEEQLSFLESMPLEEQLDLLDQALAEHDEVQAVHDRMVDTYLAGDLQALQAVAQAQMDELDPETRSWFMEQGIDARNRRMADNALPLLEAGCAFIAVGALHLPGEEGLLTLLREAGYRLEPLPSPFLSVQEGP